jgi:cyclophilin family peptidyl-prolyl cis-trans isomerase
MKSLSLFLLLAAPLHAELLATFATTRGNVIVSLHFDKTPQTVANFITLAQGTRGRIDPATGAVIRKPLYAGETFYKVVTDPFSGGYAQTGSGTGTTNGGPGYTFRDEFDASLPHGPYILAMQNEESPHTNGSQIYFTGENGYPPDEGKNTVFGIITDETSKSVIRSILAAGNNGTTINSIGFQRTSQAAGAFNEHAQSLPACSGFSGKLEVEPGIKCVYATDDLQPAGSVFQPFRSLNLQTWTKLGIIYQGSGMIAEGNGYILDNALAPRAFYNISLVTYPDALAPASMAKRILEFETATARKFIVNYDDTGVTGTFEDTNNPGVIVGIVSSSYNSVPYKAEWVFNLSDGRRFGFSCNLDSENAVEIMGRNSSYEIVGMTQVDISSGGLALSKP